MLDASLTVTSMLCRKPTSLTHTKMLKEAASTTKYNAVSLARIVAFMAGPEFPSNSRGLDGFGSISVASRGPLFSQQANEGVERILFHIAAGAPYVRDDCLARNNLAFVPSQHFEQTKFR